MEQHTFAARKTKIDDHQNLPDPTEAMPNQTQIGSDPYQKLIKEHALLQTQHARLREEVERFLKKRAGYGELREALNEISRDENEPF